MDYATANAGNRNLGLSAYSQEKSAETRQAPIMVQVSRVTAATSSLECTVDLLEKRLSLMICQVPPKTGGANPCSPSDGSSEVAMALSTQVDRLKAAEARIVELIGRLEI